MLTAAGAGLILPALPVAKMRGIARLTARPGIPRETVSPGLAPLGLETGRDGLLYVPPAYSPGKPAALMLALHGATGSARGPMNLLQPVAEKRGLIVLSVDSRDGTWDAIRSGFGPDVAFINRALAYTFDRCAIDPARLLIGGFSDGASYALGLGLPNGDLFMRIIAFSPGMIPTSDSPDQGKPPIFMSHGTRDPVLPIERTSRILSRGLRSDGFDVTMAEFDGVHEIPPAILQQAMDWCLGPKAGPG